MKNKFTYIILIFFCFIKSNAQELSRGNLISQLKGDKNALFVINGVLYQNSDSIKIDNELKKIKSNRISEISILKNKGELIHPRPDVILIQYALELPNKVIKKKFKEVKTKFTDNYSSFPQHIYSNANDPVLYINRNKIQHTEIKKIISRLKVKDIGYIYISQIPQSEEYHGQNAKNGFISIWTKSELAKMKD